MPNSHRFFEHPVWGIEDLRGDQPRKENVALVELNLDLLADDTKPNGTLYWENGPENFDFRDFLAMEITHKHDPAVINKLPKSLHKVYQHLNDS
ncbi:MAG: hypothetical protein U5K69_14080 [Balneolaceae bacterium]|nr:hypothetical protein [Balneolaceae bacterium]